MADGFGNKFLKFMKGVIYVDSDDEEEKKEESQEKVKETAKEEVKPQPVKTEEKAAKGLTTDQAKKPAEPSFITLGNGRQFHQQEVQPAVEKKETAAKEETKTEKQRPTAKFKGVDVISPLGPSEAVLKSMNAKTEATLEARKAEEKKFKPIVQIVSAIGPEDNKPAANDDVEDQVANLTIDNFLSGEETVEPETQPAEVIEEPEEVQAQPAETVEPEVINGDEIVGYEIVEEYEYVDDVDHLAQEDQQPEVVMQEVQNDNSLSFDIPEEEKKEEGEKYENMSLFDFTEDKQ